MTPPRVEYGPVALYDLNFSTDWSQGGPIIEREKISPRCQFFMRGDGSYDNSRNEWVATHWELPVCGVGPTPLIAAMRCFVASRLGDEVEIPEELL